MLLILSIYVLTCCAGFLPPLEEENIFSYGPRLESGSCALSPNIMVEFWEPEVRARRDLACFFWEVCEHFLRPMHFQPPLPLNS
jgi:hypothetical protein